jgi:hypothetical protein
MMDFDKLVELVAALNREGVTKRQGGRLEADCQIRPPRGSLMPVEKFRTLEEWQDSKRDLWLRCDDPALPGRIRAHWARWSRLVPLNVPRGVHKYRSNEEADADSERWEQERIDRIRSKHGTSEPDPPK